MTDQAQGEQHEGAAHAFSLPIAALQTVYLCSSLDASTTWGGGVGGLLVFELRSVSLY